MTDGAKPERPDRRLLMLGLDAISLPFIRENLDRLPFLASLLKSETCRSLESPAAYFSDSVWPTFMSGRSPGEHGQYFAFQWSGEEHAYRRLADRRWSDELDVQPFWHRLAREGVRTIAFDVGHALNDERAPCLQITNWSYQSSGAATTSQPEVLKDIKRRFGRRPIGHEVPIPKNARQCDDLRERMISAVRAKADATIHLMERPWDLFVTGWYEMHRAGHNLWPVEGDFASDAAPEAMLEVYEECDRQLARVWQAVEKQGREASLLLFSLHGMGPNRVQDHFLPEIVNRLNHVYLGHGRTWSDKPKSLNAMAYLRRALPPTLQYWAASILGEKVQDIVVSRALAGGRDWSETPSFTVLSGGEGLIRLNIKGREAQGFFEPGSKELADYVEWLRESIMAIRVSGTQEPLAKSVVVVDETFPGARRHFLPDLIVQWAPDAPVHRAGSPEIGEIEVSLATGRGGNHNADAFVIAKGDDALLAASASAKRVADLSAVAEGFLLAR